MIPYFEQPSFTLGPISIYPFGILIGAGILITFLIIRKCSNSLGLNVEISEKLFLWILVASFLMAHIIERLVYFPLETLNNPLSMLKVWDGTSSFGGFLGAAMAIIIFFHFAGIRSERWQYLDVIAYAFPTGWFLGRTGCFLAFDHPGTPTSFFIGQTYTDGIVRHNLGLEEALFIFFVATVFLFLGRNKIRPTGFFSGLLCVIYAPVRFLLDFLRIEDATYLGLTPGQYGSLIILLFGIWILRRSYENYSKNEASRI